MTSIYYTGVGAKKSGKHSVKEFLAIMNKHFAIDCEEYTDKLDYKPCVEYKAMNSKVTKQPKLLKNKNWSKTYTKQLTKCMAYKPTKKRKCDLNAYINFSGAELN
jgi:hypothetical protein